MKKGYLFLIISIALLILIVISLIFSLSKNPTPTKTPAPSVASPTQRPSFQPIIIPPAIDQIPQLPATQGGGADLNSSSIKASEEEIAKLSPSLPYQEDLTLSTGVKTSVLIPQTQYQINAWTLSVQIFDIKYQLPPEDKDYDKMKTSFLEASRKIFDWMESKGVDPSKIIINWGDKDYIQQRAEQWLKEQK